jgi:hypothetical protein
MSDLKWPTLKSGETVLIPHTYGHLGIQRSTAKVHGRNSKTGAGVSNPIQMACCQVVGVSYIPPFLLENSVPTGSLRRHEGGDQLQTVLGETVGRCLRLDAWVIDRVEVIRAIP